MSENAKNDNLVPLSIKTDAKKPLFDSSIAFDNYYPVLKLVRKVQAYYAGRLPDSCYPKGKATQLVCSDVVGELIEQMIISDKTYGVKMEDEEIYGCS